MARADAIWGECQKCKRITWVKPEEKLCTELPNKCYWGSLKTTSDVLRLRK